MRVGPYSSDSLDLFEDHSFCPTSALAVSGRDPILAEGLICPSMGWDFNQFCVLIKLGVVECRNTVRLSLKCVSSIHQFIEWKLLFLHSFPWAFLPIEA